MRSQVVDIRKHFNTRRTFLQVAAEQPRACLNGLEPMSWNPATVHQPLPTGSQHLIIGDRVIRDLTEILLVGQTTAFSIDGAPVAQVIEMLELQNNDRVETHPHDPPHDRDK